MSDWQKVRVTFQDADGSEVSAVMWRLGFSLLNHKGGSFEDHPGFLYMEHGSEVKVDPIRELPTGVGAVIRVTDYCDGMTAAGGDDDVYVRGVGEFWTDVEGGFADSDDMADWQYEVLSEGIQIGGNDE